MTTSRRLAVLALTAVTLSGACTTGHYQDAAAVDGMPGEAPLIITPLHYWETSRQVVREFIEGQDDLQAIVAQSRAACVRLEVRVAHQGSNYTEIQGSGFLVRGRFVLTSGHSLAGATDAEIRVTLADGRGFDAQIIEASFDEFSSSNADVALLEVMTDEDLPSLPIADPRSGETVLALGYPGKHGVNRAGHVVNGNAYGDAPLQPLAVVAAVEDDSPVVLRPLAGAIITGGMSGSPVIDVRGCAIGILNNVTTYPDVDGVLYTYEASSSLVWGPTVEGLSVR